jgi:cell division protein FtsZ
MVMFIDEEPQVPNPPVKNDNIERFELADPEPVNLKIQPENLPASKIAATEPVTNVGVRVQPRQEVVASAADKDPVQARQKNTPTVASGGYLSKPANIYSEPAPPSTNIVKQPEQKPAPQPVQKEEEPMLEMKLVIKEESVPDEPVAPIDNQVPVPPELPIDEVEEQKRRALERVQKLRNLSFNINGTDAKNEFETVPAYIRRNLELYNTVNSVENFYSNYTVKPDENNKAQISTINTFLDGKKPD